MEVVGSRRRTLPGAPTARPHRGVDRAARRVGGPGGIHVHVGATHEWTPAYPRQEGNDLTYGEQGNDVLDGGPGFDALDGGPGFDALDGGPRVDACFAGLDGAITRECE